MLVDYTKASQVLASANTHSRIDLTILITFRFRTRNNIPDHIVRASVVIVKLVGDFIPSHTPERLLEETHRLIEWFSIVNILSNICDVYSYLLIA